MSPSGWGQMATNWWLVGRHSCGYMRWIHPAMRCQPKESLMNSTKYYYCLPHDMVPGHCRLYTLAVLCSISGSSKRAPATTAPCSPRPMSALGPCASSTGHRTRSSSPGHPPPRPPASWGGRHRHPLALEHPQTRPPPLCWADAEPGRRQRLSHRAGRAGVQSGLSGQHPRQALRQGVRAGAGAGGE